MKNIFSTQWSPLVLGIFSLSIISLSGCASMYTLISDQPVDTDHGKRTRGARIEDHSIETKFKINSIVTNPSLKNERIQINSYNGIVLLTGQVSNDNYKQHAEAIARKIRHVKKVHNELTVASPISTLAKASDAWLTFKIRNRLLFNSEINSRRILVETENGVVYLMGLVTRQEADQIVQSVARTRGVQKIVKMFEYIRAD